MREAMAALADINGECHLPMTYTTKTTSKNIVHIQFIRPDLWNKDIWMTVLTGQPFGMGHVWKTYIGHGLGVFHDHIQVQGFHGLFAQEIGAGMNDALIQRLDPIGLSPTANGDLGEGLGWILQHGDARVVRIMNAVFAQRWRIRPVDSRISRGFLF